MQFDLDLHPWRQHHRHTSDGATALFFGDANMQLEQVQECSGAAEERVHIILDLLHCKINP